MSSQFLWGVQVAGLGDANLDISSIKTVFSTRKFANLIELPDSIYMPALAKHIFLGGRELEPLEGLCSQSTVSFSFDQLDRAQDFTGRVLGVDSLKYFWIPSGVRPGATLQASFNDSILNFIITTKTGFGAPALNSILYVSREAMVVQATATLGGNDFLITVFSRGALGTVAAAHDLRDPDVFYDIQANPLRIDREVTLYQLDLESFTETVRFRGVVERTKINKNLSQVTLSCRDLLGRLTMQSLGADRWEGEVRMRRGMFDATRMRYLYVMATGGNGSPVPYRPLYADNPGSVGGRTEKIITVEVEGHALLLWAKEPTLAAVPGEPWAFYHRVRSMGRVEEADGNTLDPGDDIKIYTAREILIINANKSYCLCRDASGVATDHPADIIRNILTTTGTAVFPDGGPHVVGDNGPHDWLEKPWGLGLESGLVDGPAFDDLLTEAPTGSDDPNQTLRASSTYLGASGEEKGLAALFSFAQAMNCYIYLTPENLFSIRHFSDPGAGRTDHTIGTALIRALSRDEALGSEIELEERPSIYRIRFECAQKGPGGDPGFFLHAEDFGERRLQRYAYLCEEDVLESTRIYGDPFTHTVALRLIDQLIEVFAFRWESLQMQLPQYVIHLTNAAPRVVAGEWIELSHPSIFNNEYTRGISNHRCLVYRDKLDTATERQTLHVVDFAPLDLSTTLVAPSWTLSTVVSDTIFAIQSARHSVDDLAFFQVDPNAKYNLWSSQLALRSTDGPVDAISLVSNTVVLSGAWMSGAAPVTPALGDIMRVADYDNRGSWNSLLGFANTWIADAQGKLGAADDDGYFWSV